MDEQLDIVSDAVELPVQSPLPLARRVAMDDGLHAFFPYCSNDSVGVVPSVGYERTTSRVSNEVLRHHRVMHVARSQRDVDRPPLGVDKGVELR